MRDLLSIKELIDVEPIEFRDWWYTPLGKNTHKDRAFLNDLRKRDYKNRTHYFYTAGGGI